MINPIPAKARRRLRAAIETQCRHYTACLRLIPAVDAEVFASGMRVFADESAFAIWLCSPARALENRVPIKAIQTKTGRRLVVEILEALAHGNVL